VTTPGDHLLEALQERAKELSTIYRVNEACRAPQSSLDEVFRNVVRILPAGWQFPETCVARVTVDGTVYGPPGAVVSPWRQAAPIRVQGEAAGTLEVFYGEERPAADEGPFLKEERRLLEAVAERIGQLLLERRLLDALNGRREEDAADAPGAEWRVIVDFLRQTDPRHLIRLSRRFARRIRAT
jgi:pyruvate, water dikinase